MVFKFLNPLYLECLLILLVLVEIHLSTSKTIFFGDIGGIPNKNTKEIYYENTRILNNFFLSMEPHTTIMFERDQIYYLMGGIIAENLSNVTLHIDSTLVFTGKEIHNWPKSEGSRKPIDCFNLINSTNVTLTSSNQNPSQGLIDGSGSHWWGIPFIGYLIRQENRPKLLKIRSCQNIVVNNITLKDSPYWTFHASDIDTMEVYNTNITARRTSWESHSILDLSAFNTDGFDISHGRNVHIHDCWVWNQDDIVAVKDHSENMLFERINGSGVGFTIGSIGNSKVNNITFRDMTMPHTFKGIYMKFRGGSTEEGGSISNILYQNITMYQPEQWPIWIGPAQQSDSINLCAAHPCSLCWPLLHWAGAQCNMPENFRYENITLKDITIIDPKNKYGVGVIMGNQKTPIKNILFDNVNVFERNTDTLYSEIDNMQKKAQRKDYYVCEGVENGRAINSNPKPVCFK